MNAYRPRKGFTLLELIVGLTLIAIFVTAMIPFVTNSLTRSIQPAFELEKTLQLVTDMDAINADYKNNYTADLETLRTRINARIYGGGAYTVVANKYVVYTDTNDDGTWEESDDTSGTNNVLLVTISNETGTACSRLFVKQ